MKNVCILIEHKDGVLTSNSRKILHMAQELKKNHGYRILAFLFDQNVDAFLSFLENTEIDTIFYAKLDVNRYFLSREEINNLAGFLRNISPDIVWSCNSSFYKMLMPKIAYLLNTGLCAACLDYEYDSLSGGIQMIRMAYSNHIYAQIAVHRSKPLMATISDDSKTTLINYNDDFPVIRDITPDVVLPNTNCIPCETIKAVNTICLNSSKIVIGLGNGIENMADLSLFNKLAVLLNNAAIGGTRELVNKQIIPHNWQIGSTGIQIYADLYIAFGISGAPQHIQGIERVKRIVSVNHDPYAAIFQYSDYGIVGDLFEVARYMINYLERNDPNEQ